MKCGVRVHFYVAGGVALLALAGCGRSFLHYGEERASWRHEAEVTCLKSGAVKLGAGVVQIDPIAGPGMCGAEFPLKVALLGEGTAMGYADDLRPPEGIPNASMAQPRWPAGEPRYASPPVQSAPIQNGNMRWVPGPPPVERPEVTAPARYAPDVEQPDPRGRYAPPSESYPQQIEQRDAPRYEQRYEQRYDPAPAGRPMSIYAPGVAAPDDIPDDAVLPPGRAQPAYPRTQPAYNAPVYQAPAQRALPALGPMRGPNTTAAIMPAAVTPPATLACPLVSALDRWVSEGVQPAALRWFGAQVTEIKQIGSYSCREMVGSGTSSMSEHAFGDALDIAGFTLADGRKITVKDGWRGTPEEQGFLHDVQLHACDMFTTVLAPGYNVYHYDHIHVDLMRRSSGRHPCRPDAISGEVAAAKARTLYASKQRGPAYTGSIATFIETGKLPVAVPGGDGYVAGEDGDAMVTGSIGASRRVTHGVDHEFDVTDPAPAPARPAPQQATPVEDRMTKVY
jgi:Extensin-like protein C-terminus